MVTTKKKIYQGEIILEREFIRVSIGTAAAIGLVRIKVKALPTTAYLMTYSENKCTANCIFCAQARESKMNNDYLSRVIWPKYPLDEVIEKINEAINNRKIFRICVQTINIPNLMNILEYQLEKIATKIKGKVPLSLAIHPISRKDMKRLKKLGVSDLSISFDAVTPEIFEKIKGKSTGNNYTWEGHWRALLDALDIYGKWHVSTHIIIGFGESERDAINFLQKMNDLGVIVGIMALTPIRGTKIENMKPPDISSYRKIQLAYYLIRHKITNFGKMTFDDSGNLLDFGVSKKILKKVIKSGYPFITTGCSYCNRPYYNESPSGIIYNFPMRPNEEDIRRIRKELGVEDE